VVDNDYLTRLCFLLYSYEDNMEISDISLEMEFNGVSAEDISAILDVCRTQGFESNILDTELQKRGYEALFSVDYDSYDEWEDDEYASVEKFPIKEQFH